MAGCPCDDDDDNIDWNTEDEQEIENYVAVSSGTSLAQPGCVADQFKASSSAGPSNSKLFDHFVAMGFSEKLVGKAIKENGEENADSVLNALLTYSELDSSPEMQLSTDSEQCMQKRVDSEQSSFEDNESNFNDNIDPDSNSDNELFEEENKLLCLVDMGYSVAEVYTALERCGENASIEELADMICAAQMARADDALFGDLPSGPKPSLRQLLKDKRKKRNYFEKNRSNKLKRLDEDQQYIRLPQPMIGFGVPTEPCLGILRSLPDAVNGPPYFYFENVAFAPKGAWNTISRFLYDIEPEFVDSKYFCAAARKRGYVHNLPISNRFPLLPLPPRTISEAFPLTRKWWPSWDTRTKLNCLLTSIGSARSTEKIRKSLEAHNGEPPPHVQKIIIDECKKWNFVWVGRNKVAVLEPDEVEMLLGFPKNHTRGGGISRTDRYKSLGNSFQVDTVAYHLSVLKSIFPNGINLLSLFSGIGGAEVALHRLGIPLKNVVSVEILEANRNIVASWWEQTNQKGNLIHIPDVQQLDAYRIEELMCSFGGFDLVIGGSPCNNLAGSNRVSRDGLQGKDSSLFYDFFRILDLVKSMSKVKM